MFEILQLILSKLFTSHSSLFQCRHSGNVGYPPSTSALGANYIFAAWYVAIHGVWWQENINPFSHSFFIAYHSAGRLNICTVNGQYHTDCHVLSPTMVLTQYISSFPEALVAVWGLGWAM